MDSIKRSLPKKTLVRDARAVVATCPGLNARLAARRITQFLEHRTASSGLSVAQFGLMAHVAAATGDTLGALAARVGLDQSTLSRNLRGLEKDGLVEIATIETDLRRRSVWLTEAGARRLEAALPIWCRAHASLARLIELDLVVNLATATEILFDGATYSSHVNPKFVA
jgi:DNA-binding MarR family transcriptional regulator